MSVRNLYAGAAALMFAMTPAMALAQSAETAQAPAAAEGATELKVGATVSDTQGNAVGTIEAVEGEFITVSTGTNQVRLPSASFAIYPTGPVIAMTRAELDAAAAASEDISDILVAGATVHHSDGSTVGTVDAVEGEFVTLTTATAGTKVRLPQSAFARGANGLIAGMTAAELDAAASAATNGGAEAPQDTADAPADTSDSTANAPADGAASTM